MFVYFRDGTERSFPQAVKYTVDGPDALLLDSGDNEVWRVKASEVLIFSMRPVPSSVWKQEETDQS
jgi:hypothetical protein